MTVIAVARVPERSAAAGRSPLLGCLLLGALLTRALALDLAAGHGGEDPADEATGVGRQVEVPGHCGDAQPGALGELDQVLELGQPPREPVDVPRDDDLGLAALDGREHLACTAGRGFVDDAETSLST